MSEQEWTDSNDPAAMLDFMKSQGRAGAAELRAFACACCRFVERTLSSPWPATASRILDAIERHVEIDCGAEGLADIRAEAEELSRQAGEQHLAITRHVPDSSDYVWAAEALAAAAHGDAFKAARDAATCAVAAFVGCPLCCQFNDADHQRQAMAKRSIAGLTREFFNPFEPR